MFTNLVTYHICQGADLPPYDALAYQYLIGGNGVFIRTNCRFFSAVVPVIHHTIRGLALLKPQFRLHVPRIPVSLLESILSDARLASSSNDDQPLHETLYHFYHLGHAVQVKKRPQKATAVRVQAEGDGGADVICDLHSHGGMPPFWSPIDNKDEQGARLYGVIGRVDAIRPEMKLRVGVYGYWRPLPLTAVFTANGPFKDLYQEKDDDKQRLSQRPCGQ